MNAFLEVEEFSVRMLTIQQSHSQVILQSSPFCHAVFNSCFIQSSSLAKRAGCWSFFSPGGITASARPAEGVEQRPTQSPREVSPPYLQLALLLSQPDRLRDVLTLQPRRSAVRNDRGFFGGFCEGAALPRRPLGGTVPSVRWAPLGPGPAGGPDTDCPHGP